MQSVIVQAQVLKLQDAQVAVNLVASELTDCHAVKTAQFATSLVSARHE